VAMEPSAPPPTPGMAGVDQAQQLMRKQAARRFGMQKTVVGGARL
jgi:hypothetical protein